MVEKRSRSSGYAEPILCARLRGFAILSRCQGPSACCVERGAPLGGHTARDGADSLLGNRQNKKGFFTSRAFLRTRTVPWLKLQKGEKGVK